METGIIPIGWFLTESDYERRMEFKTPMDLRLWSDLLNRSILFLGYVFVTQTWLTSFGRSRSDSPNSPTRPMAIEHTSLYRTI